MNPVLAASLVGAGSSLVNSSTSALDGYFNRRYNEAMVDKQWQRSIDQWNRENNYNHPSRVVGRMRDAGVNPALAFMNGASFAPAAASPDAQAPQSSRFGIATQLDPMMASNIRLQDAQADLLESQKKTEDATRSGKVREIDANIGNLVSQSGLADSTKVLNGALTGKAKQEQENLKQAWEQSNSRFQYDLEILQSNAKISRETAERTARSLEAAIRQAESLAKYNDVLAKYHPDVVLAAARQADAAVVNANTNTNQYYLDRDKWFGTVTPEGVRVAGESQAVQATAELQLAQLRKEISVFIRNMQESDLFDETELARIISAYVDIIKK